MPFLGLVREAYPVYAGLLTLVVVLGCSRNTPQIDGLESSRTLRRGLPGEPHTLDPQLADDSFSFPVLRDIYEGLTSEDAQGNIVAGTADHWVIERSGTSYTFHIRNNAKWSDGTEVTAAQFASGLRKAVDPRNASGSAGLLSILKNADAITKGLLPVGTLGVASKDRSTLQIDLEHPAPYLLQILSQPISAPFNETASVSKSAAKPTNGAYKLVSHVMGSYLELEKNESYWNKTNVKIERVRYLIEESESTELRQFEAQEVDLTSTVPMNLISEVRIKYPRELEIAPALGVLYLALNLSAYPFRNNQDLRRALSLAIGRDAIVKSVAPLTSPAYGLVATGVRNYSQQHYVWSTASEEERIQLARSLYRKSGFGYSNPLRVRLFFNSNEGIRRLMIAIAGNWKKNLGVETEFLEEEFKTFLDDRKNKSKWDAIRLGWFADFDDPAAFLSILESTSIQNDAGYTNRRFDQLMAEARTTSDEDVRRAKLEQAERLAIDDYPIIPIYFYNSRRLVSPELAAGRITPMNRVYSKNLYWKKFSH